MLDEQDVGAPAGCERGQAHGKRRPAQSYQPRPVGHGAHQARRGDEIHQPEHAGDLQLHRERDVGGHGRQRDQEQRHERGGAPHERALLGAGTPVRAPPPVGRPRHAERAEIGEPRRERPLVGEERGLRGQRLQPHVVHHHQAAAQRTGQERPCGYRRAGHCRRHGHPPPRRFEHDDRRADEKGEPQAGGVVHGRGGHGQRHGQPVAPVGERGHSQKADAEGQHARMEVGLERVGAGTRDLMAHRERRHERERRPRAGIEAPADQHERGEDEHERQQIAGQEQRLERRASGAHQHRQHFVGEHQVALGVDERRIAGKSAGVERPGDDRNVEGLIRDAVAIHAAVGRGQHDEGGERRKQAGSRRARARRYAVIVRQRSVRTSTAAARPAVAGTH